MSETDSHNWNSLYPQYFDTSVSLANGRRVPLASAANSSIPKSSLTVDDIYSRCQELGISEEHLLLEKNKRHPRTNAADKAGRLRVMLKEKDTGAPLYPAFPNTNSLIKAIDESM